MQLQVGVKVYLRSPAGKYLLLERSATKYPEVQDRWDIVGGRIEIGTPLLTNLAREVLEETKMTITSEPKLIAAQDILRIADRHVVRLTYVADTAEVTPTLDEEHDNFGWFTLAELNSLEGFDQYAKAILPLLK